MRQQVAPLAGLQPAEPVTAEAGPEVTRLSRGVLCLPVGGLETLAAAVRDLSVSIGQPPDDRPFHGHLTLARAKSGADLRSLAGGRIAGAWPVEEVTLVSSDTRPDGARYRVLARYRV